MINVLKADLRHPSHASALLTLMEVYERDPMGGGQGLSGFARANLVDALARRPSAHVILAFAKQEPAGLLIGLEVLEGNRAAQAAYRSVGFRPYQLNPAMGRAQFWEMPLADGD